LTKPWYAWLPVWRINDMATRTRAPFNSPVFLSTNNPPDLRSLLLMHRPLHEACLIHLGSVCVTERRQNAGSIYTTTLHQSISVMQQMSSTRIDSSIVYMKWFREFENKYVKDTSANEARHALMDAGPTLGAVPGTPATHHGEGTVIAERLLRSGTLLLPSCYPCALPGQPSWIWKSPAPGVGRGGVERV
jgi:hypothetical protein